MKVLFVTPPFTEEDRWDLVSLGILGKNAKKVLGSTERPLGISYLASILRNGGHDVEIVDSVVENLSEENFERMISKKEFDILAITAVSNSFYRAIKAADIAKNVKPESIVVVGGPHITAAQKIDKADSVLKFSKSFDFAVYGEGEFPFLKLVNELAKGKQNFSKINNLIWRKGKQIIVNKQGSLIQELDSLPFPAFDLLRKNSYRRTPASCKTEPVYPIMAGRGCPYNCLFCGKNFGRMVRMRSPDNIVKELLYLRDVMGAKEIRFWDETLTLNKKYVKMLCQKMIEQGFDLLWSCYGHVNTVDKELLRIMKKAGCWEIDFGVEAGTNRVLKVVNKHITTKEILRDFKLTQKEGIEARASFILGLPGDNRKSIMDTINFAIKLEPDYAHFYLLEVFPGAELFNLAVKEGSITEKSLEDYLMRGKLIIYQNPNVPQKEIEGYIKLAYRKFYKRPKYILKRLSKIHSFNDIRRYTRAGLEVLKI